MPTFPLHLLASADVDRASYIHRSCFDDGWPAQDFENLLACPSRFGLFHQNGFILCACVAEEAEILTFCVLPEERKKGLGRELLQAACQKAAQKGAQKIFLEVSKNNWDALSLYQKEGFFPVGERKGYYPDKKGAGQDALILRKDLQNEEKNAATS